MGKLIILLFLAGLVAMMTLATAGATPSGANGRIVFGRYDPVFDDTVIYTANPDGSHEQQLLPGPNECPHWSPDGTLIAMCGSPDGGATQIINPDTGDYRELSMPDPTNLFTACAIWSPDMKRFACESFGQSDPSLNGIYTIRSSDGRGMARMTSNPGGDDNPGDYSPDGRRFVFSRADQNGDPTGLFVVNVNGTGLKQITPTGTLLSSQGDWSLHGNEIVFSRHVTPDVHSSIWVVHADGTGLHEINVQPESACGGPNTDATADGCFQPRWSPDGKKIIFAKGTSGDTDSNIYAVNVDGTGLTQVTHGGRDQAPDWGTHPVIG